MQEQEEQEEAARAEGAGKDKERAVLYYSGTDHWSLKLKSADFFQTYCRAIKLDV